METFSILLTLCERIDRLSVNFHHKGPVMRMYDVLFTVSQNKPLDKQQSCRWFETPWSSCDAIVMRCANEVMSNSKWWTLILLIITYCAYLHAVQFCIPLIIYDQTFQNSILIKKIRSNNKPDETDKRILSFGAYTMNNQLDIFKQNDWSNYVN